jgi:hypothetical protein
MIPKKADSKHVEKLRIIVPFHSLFNMLNKKVARQATQSAIKRDAIPSQAYARPGFRSNDCGLNKVLIYDISRQRKTPQPYATTTQNYVTTESYMQLQASAYSE